MKKLIAMIALAVVLCVPCGTACAMQAGNTGNCSLPYVTDVSQLKNGKLVAVVEVAGNVKSVKVCQGSKRVKVNAEAPHVWSVKIAKGKTYTIVAVGGDGKAKSIRYKVERI